MEEEETVTTDAPERGTQEERPTIAVGRMCRGDVIELSSVRFEVVDIQYLGGAQRLLVLQTEAIANSRYTLVSRREKGRSEDRPVASRGMPQGGLTT